MKGIAAARWTPSAHLSPGNCNPGGVHAVVCSKHVIDSDGFQHHRKECADWFSQYRQQSGANIYAPLDVWGVTYTRELQEIFEQSSVEKRPYSATWSANNYGQLKEVHIQLQRELITLQPDKMNLSQEM